jgi:hypothetical protein
MSIRELASLYNVTIAIFKKWLVPHEKAIGKKMGWYYTPAQVKTIINLLGEP